MEVAAFFRVIPLCAGCKSLKLNDGGLSGVNGVQGVGGSNPLVPTNLLKGLATPYIPVRNLGV